MASMPGGSKTEARKLAILFGVIYFVQGIGEPTEGLIAQPVRSLLKNWGHSAGEIALFSALLSVPWSIKPVFGLLSDCFPILGSRRRSYLVLSTFATIVGLAFLYWAPPSAGDVRLFLVILLVPTVGVAFSDVVVDALMVEKGQPLGITGRLQSVQWAAIYLATILTGLVGGYLSQHGQQHVGFLICAVVTAVSLVLAVLVVREPERVSVREAVPDVAVSLWHAVKSRSVLGTAAFLFLWNFNPFSSSVQYVHMTREMGFSEQFYGYTVSLLAVAAVAASVAYGFYCRRVPFRVLMHISIAAGVISTLAYWGMAGQISAIWVTLLVGFAYMTGTMVQLDLAARVCPSKAAGTVFALLMSLSNLGLSLSSALGGSLYDRWTADWGSRIAFNALVALGASTTAACWLLLPFLSRHAHALDQPQHAS